MIKNKAKELTDSTTSNFCASDGWCTGEVFKSLDPNLLPNLGLSS